jgi:DNA-binding MarR family transcriptional regulator
MLAQTVPLWYYCGVNTDSLDLEFIILENIYSSSAQDEPLRQRNLARIAGISLGMTNTILKRLAKKGFISVRKLNSRNIHYLVTLEGINEIINRGYRYFKRTIKNVVYYKDRIDEVVLAAQKRNANRALLVGQSDLEFILEHSCMRHGMVFEKNQKQGGREPADVKTLVVYAETIPAPAPPSAPRWQYFYLSRMALGSAAGAS